MPSRRIVARLVVIALLPAAFSTAASGAELFAGGYSFSDELGGFRLVAASGSGTSDDPVVVREELSGIGPVILVIRRRGQTSSYSFQSQLTLVKQVVNRSGRIWSSFEVELQEVLHKPSTYSDGLSFKQFAAKPADVSSDVFTLNDRRFEPYDRITFQGGSVDPDAMVMFRMTITDPTPVPEFYLLQDPNLLSSSLPAAGRSLAVNMR